jgi:sugar phosphate isomerase/epimerase
MLDSSQTRLPIGLCIFGIAYSAGYVGRGTPRANANPLTPNTFLDLAAGLGLTSVELTTDFIDPHEDERALLAFRDRAQELGLRIVLAGPKIDAVAFQKCFQQAKLLGVSTIRCVISGLLCGDRRPMGGWQAGSAIWQPRPRS